jgi:hypothetical protein
MWEHRNGELTNPESPASLREHARLDALIHFEYVDLYSISGHDKRWFRRPAEVIATEPIEYKQQWFESVRLARARYTRRHNIDLQEERVAMRNFPRRIPTTTD